MKGRGKAFLTILAIFSAFFFISDLSQAAITPEFPTGYIYNSTSGKGEMNPFCENGSYDPSLNRCVADATYTCPSGYSFNSSVYQCEMDPVCPNGGYYNSSLNFCFATPAYSCALGGYTPNPAKYRCEAQPDCPCGSFNQKSLRCEAGSPPCSCGTSIGGVCSVSPTCSGGGGLAGGDPVVCSTTLIMTCPQNYSLNPPLNPITTYFCSVSTRCPLNGTIDKCVSSVTPVCPSGYTYDSYNKRCNKSPRCYGGSLNSAIDKCQADPYSPDTPDVNPACNALVGKPVSVSSGTVYANETDFTINGIMPITFTRYYNSKSTIGKSFGQTWASNVDTRVLGYTNGYKITDPEGSITYYLDINGDGIYEADFPRGETSKLIKNPDSTFKRIYKDGSSEEFSYLYGYLTAIVDKNGNRLTLTRDTANKLTKITDPSAREINITTNTSGKITTITLPDSKVYTYTYSGPGGFLGTVTYPDGSKKNYEYVFITGKGYYLTGIKNEKGNYIEKHTYDAQGRGITSSADGTNDLLTLNYINDTQTTVTDSLGRTTTYTYDKSKGKGHLISRTGPGCQSCGQGNIAYTYDDKLNVTTETDALGNITAYTYDANGNTLTKTEATGTSLQRTTTYTYNSLNDLIEQTGPTGTKTQYQYDAKRNLIKIQTLNPNSEILTQAAFTRDTKGQITKIQALDPNNQVLTEINITYDNYGNITSITDAQNNTTTYTYDIMGKPLTATDANGKTTTLTYDQRARLISTKDSLNNITAYTYDQAGSLITLTDAKSNATSFTYDLIGRLTKQTDPMNKQTIYTYDTQGNLTSKTDPLTNTIQYTYDALNRLIQKTYPDASTTTYQYDAIGNLTSTSNAYISYSFAYDALNRMTSVSDSLGKSISYAYDANSNRTSMTSPIGTTSYTYNALNLLTQLVQGTKTFGFAYDTLGRRTSLSMPNGTTTSYSYDNLSRLTNLSTLNAQIQTINSFTYTYDNVGNKLTKQDPTGTHNFTYDNTYQLTQATHPSIPTEAFAYDAVGNRTNTTVDAANKLLQDANATYQYDNNGNRYIKTQSDGTIIYYSYDYEGRLTRVESQKPGLTTVAVYKYDPLGRRIEKAVTENSVTVTTRYLYDGLNIIAEYDVNGNITTKYIHGLGIDEPLAMEKNSSTYYYHADGLGSVVALSDSSGAIVQSYEYNSFGNITSTLNPNFVQPYMFTGREYDKETGLLFYRARVLDSKTGTFTQKDPIGFAGGDVNLYRYVGNDPINWIDPLGLFDITVGNRKWRYRPSDHHGVNPPEVHLDTVDSGPKKKLGAETGKVYDSKGKTVCGKISKKNLARVQSKLQKLGYLGMALTVYGVYESMTADEAQALEDLLNILESIPKDRGERMLKEIIENNPDKFQEVKP